jgi:hypothetical protein
MDGNPCLGEESPFQSKEIVMSRFRKLWVRMVAGLALAPGLASVHPAEAGGRSHHVPQHHQHRNHHGPQYHQPSSRHEHGVATPYSLYLRRSPNAPWTRHGVYSSYQQATEALNQLRASGYEAFAR